MKQKLDDTTQEETNEDDVAPKAGVNASGKAGADPRASRSRLTIIIAAIALVLVAGGAAWLFWPRQTGKPVPAPRSVSFEETSNQPTAIPGDQRLTLAPEQVQRAGLKIEIVGEQSSAQAAGQMSTGTVQANTYKETPVMSLVGGIVRSVSGELGQNVKRGEKIAVVFSNELAETESRYLAAVAALDEHHRHHVRTMKLVEIGAASRQDLETATTQYREAKRTSLTCAKSSYSLVFHRSGSILLIRPRKSALK